MTETSEQRIERVARAMIDKIGVPDHALAMSLARAADAISFRAGWDAAVEALRRTDVEETVAAYLEAFRPGETR